MGKEDELKLIAYSIWQEEGCVDGHDCEHWFRAETIWEQSYKTSAVESTKTDSKRAAKQRTMVTGKQRTPKKA
jgi:hypothetical protein